MESSWPALCTLAALIALLVLIIRYQVNAFVALLVVSLGLGLAAGLPPERVVDVIAKGVGDIMRDVAVILALGAMLGRMLEACGAAEVIARTLINTFGEKRASLAILVAAYLIGIPVLFNVGFLLLMPIMYRLQKETGRSLLYFMLPLSFSLGITHSLVPPHPGIVGAVNALHGQADAGKIMVQTIIFGSLMGVPLVLLGWFGPGLWWSRQQHVTVPEHMAAPATAQDSRIVPPSFFMSVLIVTLPLLLSVAGFGAQLMQDLKLLPPWLTTPLLAKDEVSPWFWWLGHAPLRWLQFLGKPTMALLIPTGLAFLLMGARRGLSADKLAAIAGKGLNDVGSMLFLFGAAGGFKEVIQASGAGAFIAEQMRELPFSPLVSAYLVAVLMRIALGSATASILTASALLVQVASNMPGQETLLVLAVACGVTFMTQPADSGFWMVKEFGNLSVRDVMVRFNACRIPMSLAGLGLLLVAETLW